MKTLIENIQERLLSEVSVATMTMWGMMAASQGKQKDLAEFQKRWMRVGSKKQIEKGTDAKEFDKLVTSWKQSGAGYEPTIKTQVFKTGDGYRVEKIMRPPLRPLYKVTKEGEPTQYWQMNPQENAKEVAAWKKANL